MIEKPNQGFNAGRRFPAVDVQYIDEKTGTTVQQLTDFRAHSNHLYFTNNGWYDDGTKLLFNSDRDGSYNLYSVDIETGVITQLTDLPEQTAGSRQYGSTASVNPEREEVYFWHDTQMVALDINRLTLRELYSLPENFSASSSHSSLTVDGRYVCTSITEDVPEDTTKGLWNAKPTTRLLRIPIDGKSDTEIIHEEENWLSHVQTSPTQQDIITFAQEGPWDQTSQRIWGLNAETGKTWKIRPEDPEEEVGHEYWLDNGRDVAYHGRYPDGKPFFGITEYDNSNTVEFDISDNILEYGKKGTQSHFHSNTRELIVSDGSPTFPYLTLWRFDESTGEYSPPRILAKHDLSTFKFGRLHVHPRFSPDGEYVLFLSDMTEYGNLYLSEVPVYESLPLVESVQ